MGRKDTLQKLLFKINESIEYWGEWILKWTEAGELMRELKDESWIDYIKDNIIKRKIQKLQKEPNTIWSDLDWYTGWGIFKKWQNLIELDLNNWDKEID